MSNHLPFYVNAAVILQPYKTLLGCVHYLYLVYQPQLFCFIYDHPVDIPVHSAEQCYQLLYRQFYIDQFPIDHV